MATITVTLPEGTTACNGKQVTFRAPCDCTGVTGIVIDGNTYDLIDTLGVAVGDMGEVFMRDAMVSVILDTETSSAYIQNPAPTPKIEVVQTSGGADSYSVTVPGITDLTKGASFILIANADASVSIPTLDVNGLGAKPMRRKLSDGSDYEASVDTIWLFSGSTHFMIYDGECWIPTVIKPSAADLEGITPVSAGGTGYNSIEDTTYTTVRYRGSSLNSTETNPTQNGTICWTYE